MIWFHESGHYYSYLHIMESDQGSARDDKKFTAPHNPLHALSVLNFWGRQAADSMRALRMTRIIRLVRLARMMRVALGS